MRSAFFASVLVAFGLAGCEEPMYTINAPADLQHKIDSIAAAKAAIDTGDTTYIDISTSIVGAEDNSSAWNTAFSDYFAIPPNKLLHMEFVNYGSGENNWNNWNLDVTNRANRDASDYAEYFVLRSDAYGWGNSDFDIGVISQDYPDTDGDGDIWNDFRATMEGAHVSIDIDHSVAGYAFVTATAVGTNGTVLTETYNQPVSATDTIQAFLICDHSHFDMKKAYLLPSEVTAIVDQNPTSISVSGTPKVVAIGDENFWGNGVATVTFADGSTVQADSADLSFNVVPDMTTLGTKTVTVAYSKTKEGAYGPAVSTFYDLEVKNPVQSIAVTQMPDITTYYFFNSDSIAFDTSGLQITATYSDASTDIMDLGALKFDSVAAVAGSQDLKVTYKGATGIITTTIPLTLVKGTGQVGASNFSSGWWTVFSDDYTVASGASKTFTMYCYSDNLQNYHSPSTILRKASALPTSTEYGVVRMDNFGWGDGYGTAVLTSDWNWDIFTSSINGSKVVITVTNNGDNTANVRYDVTYATGETHFQEYAGITIDSSDLSTALVIEEAYLVFVN